MRLTRIGLLAGSFGVLLGSVLTGCAENFPKPKGAEAVEFSRHYIVIHPDGYPLGQDNEKVPTGTFETLTREAVTATLPKPSAAPCPSESSSCKPIRLLVFIHGGLNSYQSDFDRMVKLMKGGGLLDMKQSPYDAIFVNWDSSLNALVDDLFWIRLGDRMRDLGPISFPFILPARMALAVGNIPVRLAHTVISYKEYCDFAANVKTCGSSAEDYVSWGMFPFYTMTAPILDSFGSPAWYQMKRRAKLATAGQLTTVTDDRWASDAAKKSLADAEGAALTLVRALRDALQKQKRRVEVTLIGHSMGAFIVNRMLSAVSTLECGGKVRANASPASISPLASCLSPDNVLPIKQIVYLAPASPLEEFDTITLPFVAKHPGAQAWVFALNRKDEAGEYSTPAQWLVPRGSLLTWIDGIFEPASSIGEKTLGRMANLEKYYGSPALKDDQDKIEPYQLACPAEETAAEKLISQGQQSTNGFRPVRLTLSRLEQPVQSRVHVYQSLGFCKGKHEGPERHGDFSRPRYLGQALCVIDPDALENVRFCRSSPNEESSAVRRMEPALSD